jgi:DNA-binding response OmpR family regulator
MGSAILLVEDDQGFLSELRRPLDEAGYEVFEARDGASALDAINRLRSGLALVVIDLALPVVSGFEVLGALTRRKVSVKTIVLTGVLKDLYLELARNMGADLALRKPAGGEPFSPCEWLNAVRTVLSN